MPIILSGPDIPAPESVDNKTIDSTVATLNRGVVFIAVYTHMWTGQAKIRNAMVKLGHTELARELVTNPRWNLLPDTWRKKFNGVYNLIQKVINQATISSDEMVFPIRGVHIVARRNYKELANQIKAIERNDFIPLVNQFVKEWPDIVKNLVTKIDDIKVADAFMAKLPNQTKLASKFWIEIIRVPIKLGADAQLDAVDEQEMIEIVEQGQRFTKNVANLIVQGLEEELRGSIDNLLERIKDKGIIKQGTLEMVKTAFKKLQDFDFVMTDELRAKLNQAPPELLNTDYKGLNYDIRHDAGQMADGLVTYLQSVREQAAADASTMRVFGRGRRSIRTQ